MDSTIDIIALSNLAFCSNHLGVGVCFALEQSRGEVTG